MSKAKLIQNGHRQALHIKRVREAAVFLPQQYSWGTLFQSLQQFEPGFTLVREQPQSQQKRSTLWK